MSFTRALYTSLAVTGAPGLASAPLAEAESVTDTVSVAVTDVSALLMSVAITVTDTVSVSVSDASSVAIVDFDFSKTALGVTGGPSAYQTLVAKSVVTLFDLSVSDTLNVQWLEQPVDSNEILTADTVRVSSVDISSLLNRIDVLDTPTISVSETVGVVQSGVTAKDVTDTLSVTLTDISTVYVTLVTADSVSVSVTDTSALLTPTQFLAVTDDLNVSVSESYSLGIFAGVQQVTVSDMLSVSLLELADASVYVPVVPATPLRIRIIPRIARIRIVEQ